MKNPQPDWLKISFVVAAEQVEHLSELLEMMLAQAVTQENAGEDEFYEVAFPGTPDWQMVAVSGLFDGRVEPQPIIDFVQQQFGEQEVPVQVQYLQNQNWQRVWLESLKPIKVGDKLWVCPSWCEPTALDERNIILDPGLAFGTGTHATTAMCLDWLSRQSLRGKTVLDYGCGSGILAIAALLSEADSADAVDIDPLAVSASQENAERNKVSDRLKAYLPDAAPHQKQYDVVIANILADVLIELREQLLAHLADGGQLLLTGILDKQVDRVMQAFAGEINFSVQSREHWRLLIGEKK